MEQTILTPHQSQVLELAEKNINITERYYFTGGTALAEFYLKHRYSEDLDFFTTHEINFIHTREFIESLKDYLPIKGIEEKPISGLYMYKLKFSDNSILKIDFNEYPFSQVEFSNKKFGNLKIDSLYDIAVNKLASILGRSKSRDFVDMYILLQQEGYFWDQLFDRVKDKFGLTYEASTIATQFSKVQDLTDYPAMLIPFNKDEMIDFYLASAKKLGKRIFK